jgi:hypothetical protein
VLTKPLLLALLAACGVNSSTTTTEPPTKAPPSEPSQEDQHFCCHDVDQKSLSGDGCVTIGKEQINSCNNVLYCSGNWSKKDGHVVCE